MNKYSLAISLALLLALSACTPTATVVPVAPIGPSPTVEVSDAPTPVPTPTPEPEATPTIWGERTYRETSPGIGMPSCVLDISVPFTVAEGPGYDAINDYYRKYLLDVIPERIDEYLPVEDQPPNGPFERSSFDVVYEGNSIVSFLFLNYHYWGGAHGLYDMRSDNFNITTGQKLTFSDFFTDQDEAQRRIVAEVRKQIREETEDVGYGELELVEVAVDECFNPESFYPTQDGLIFYYQNTDLGNPTYGPHYFEISNSLLEDILIT